jgi:arsenate reductase
VKKARVWLAEQGLDYAFHDYKKAGVDAGQLADWVARAGLDVVLNRAGQTYKKLPEEAKADLTPERAVALMVAHPSAIKRPIVVRDGTLLVGFKPADWEAALSG